MPAPVIAPSGAFISSHAHDRRFSELIDRATSTRIEGWHFSFLEGRQSTTPLPWSYEQLVTEHLTSATRVLDVDTGGGEILARLSPPAGSIAIEDWSTNIPIARARLDPLGVSVRQRTGGRLPVADGSVDLVLNRHGELDLAETARVLKPGGVIVSQQVAMGNESEISDVFGVEPTVFLHAVIDVADLNARVEAAGLMADLGAEAVVVTRYLDVGALVLQLRAVSWQVPGFTVDAHLDVLWQIHRQIESTGSFDVHSRRVLLVAHRPRWTESQQFASGVSRVER